MSGQNGGSSGSGRCPLGNDGTTGDGDLGKRDAGVYAGMMDEPTPPVAISRDDLAGDYLATLPYEPYPVQEEALLAWFTAEQGVLVCAPTGMGKTLIAEAAMYEALRTGSRAYYTTPLIALTDQKFDEMRRACRIMGIFGRAISAWSPAIAG